MFGSNEVVEVLAKFQPYPGVYMWHCHNSVHEDAGMMAVFNVTRLPDFGYNDLEEQLEDPMDIRFRPRLFVGTNLENVKLELLPSFARLNAYPDPVSLKSMEEKYWADRSDPLKNDSGAKASGEIDPGMLDAHNSHHGGSGTKGIL
jgi:hypothetical protein